jgi:hypothetical protein
MPPIDSQHTQTSDNPDLSLVVVAYNMARELPRTLHSLSRHYQRDIDDLNYEVIVVDNGSSTPVPEGMVTGCGPQFRLLRIDNASPSPAAAMNAGVAASRGQRLGLVIDGARLVTPGVLYWASRAANLHPSSIVSVVGFHLGPDLQRLAKQTGYNQQVEDRLLERINWRLDGYRLFQIASLASSSLSGWAGPMAESNCLFLNTDRFLQLGGFDERFNSPGGGLVNLDFYKRAVESPNVELVCLAGEGSFHQIHGGITTGGNEEPISKFDNMQAEYQAIRDCQYQVPQRPATLLGRAQVDSNALLASGASHMARSYDLDERRQQLMTEAGLTPREAD